MATPLPFPGLSALLVSYGKVFKSRRSFPHADGGERPTITAMIPALNEERTIPYALVSLAVQTVTPDRIVVVDDGSTDDTARITTELDDILDVPIDLWQHDEPMGKTVGVKEVARSVETDTVFVLDADTFLESEDYLERLLAPHIESDVASSFGVAYPTETSSKRKFHEEFSRWVLPPTSVTRLHVETDLEESESRSGPIDYLRSKAPVVQYRNVSYHVEQRFFGDGFYRVFDSALFPVGCGVLYDREKLVTVFDDYEESLGDDLTNSEDIFIGFAFSDRGWTNVHVDDTYMRSEIPGLKGTFKQNYLWGSGFLQSAYYFKNLTTRYRAHRVDPTGADGESTAKLDAAGDRSETGDISGAGPSESASSATDVDLESESSSTRGELSARAEESALAHELDRPDQRSVEEAKADESKSRNATSTETGHREDDAATVKPPLGRAVTARLIDGLYPTTILVFLVLSSFGVIGLEIVGFLVLWELSLYTALVIVTRSKRVHFVRNFVPFLVIRTLMLPVLTYTYARVATDVVTGNRNWRK